MQYRLTTNHTNIRRRAKSQDLSFGRDAGAVAGAGAAAVWAAAEPLGQRVLGTSYSDVRLLEALLTRGPWRPAGVIVHLANGAAFGAAFGRIGGHGWKQGLLAAEVENVLLWPAMAVVDRIHPDRRSGE